MCKMNSDLKEQTTAFATYTHSEYGNVVAIDVTPKFLKEYLTARMYMESMPIFANCDEDAQRFRKTMDEKVLPFFNHMDEILDIL